MKLPSAKSFWLFVLLINFAALLAIMYISSEQTFYSWDYALYATRAIHISKVFIQDPLSAIRSVYLSTNSDYNDYFTLPLIPVISLFRYSRLGFILGVVFVYYIPMLIVAGQIAKQVFPYLPNIGWITIFTGIAIPGLWASVLRGYPDIGSVFLIGIAIVSYIKDIELKNWQAQLPLIGIYSALAIVFRRHFAYNAISLFFSIGIMSFLISVQKNQWDWGKILFHIKDYIIKLMILLIIFTLTLIFFAPTFITRTISSQYLSLYDSYALSPAQTADFFFHTYGILWVLASIGFIVAFFKQRKISANLFTAAPLIIVIFFWVASSILWITVPRQASIQYTLHVALPMILGLSYLIASMTSNPNIYKRCLAIAASILLMAANLWTGLAPAHFVTFPWTLTSKNPPMQRSDYNEVLRLVGYLREISGCEKKIYVVDSSLLMNGHILQSADVSIHKRDACLRILNSPQIDSRDFYPLEPLLQADYIVMTMPFQYHLSEEDQKVVKFVYDVFAQNWEMSNDFVKMPEEFQLGEGAVLSVYERRAPTSIETLIATYYRMQNYISCVPGSQADWILATKMGDMNFAHQTRQKYSLSMSDTLPEVSYLYANSSSAEELISGTVEFKNEKCAPIQVSLRQFSFPDTSQTSVNDELSISSTGAFNILFHTFKDTALVLSFQRNTDLTAPSCGVMLEWETAASP